MDLLEKIRTLPTSPGVYLYKNAEGEVIYVGKAKSLRGRVRSYFLEANLADAKTGSLMREAADVDYIIVDNEAEAMALENNLIKQNKPRFNILLRDDKTYPYIKLTSERFPRVYVTRRLKKDGAQYFGPYFPGNLAHRLVDVIHRSFLITSCKVDLTRFHARPCLQYYIKRCLGPCVQSLTTPEIYAEAVRDVQLFLEGRQTDLSRSLRFRMERAANDQQFEAAARYRDLLATVDQVQEKQRIAAAEGDDTDVFGYHCENQMLAVNLFHMRGGRILDRREFFWDELPEQEPGQPFRVMMPAVKAIQESLQDALTLPDLPKRIECFDISHIQGAETVASMVVWEDGKMNKSQYRKFIIRTVDGVDDFASMREVVSRRYKRVLQDEKPMPSLVLIDGGLGQLHAAAEALESLEIINQPLAAIAKREEILYVYGQEKDPVVLDHHSPVLHYIQLIRDEAHRFAVTFHRKRRQMRDRSTELLEIPGVGERTTRRLLEHFGSVQAVKQADVAALSAVVTRSQAEAILTHFRK